MDHLHTETQSNDFQTAGKPLRLFREGRSNGSLFNFSIMKPSGSPILDDAALKIIRKTAEKLPPLPAALNGHSDDYVVPILLKEKKGRRIRKWRKDLTSPGRRYYD